MIVSITKIHDSVIFCNFFLNIDRTNIRRLIFLFIKMNHSDLRQRCKYYTEKLLSETNLLKSVKNIILYNLMYIILYLFEKININRQRLPKYLLLLSNRMTV